MDDAPMLHTEKGRPDTTARHVLQALAEHAHRNGTGARPSVLRLQYRTGYDRRTVQRALRRLEDAGLIDAQGAVNGCTSYTLDLSRRRPASDWAALETEETAERGAAAERKRRSRSKSVTHSNDVTVTHADDVTDADVTHSNDGRHALQMRDVTHSASGRHALSAARTIKEPTTEPPRTKDSSPTPTATEPDEDLFGPLAAISETIHKQRATDDLSAFGDFWLLYPKKRDRGEALKAWKAAVKDGADPARITEAARQYARERAGQDPRYTKYPATWLNKGCYDDEPDPQPGQLRAVSGSYQPFRNPADESVWDEGLI